MAPSSQEKNPRFYNSYLLLIAGLGGLLYGIDVGIIAGALPFLEATSGYTVSQLSTVVAAVLLGSVLSSLFAGLLADIFGRKIIMLLSALLFVLSIPIICLSGSFEALIAGRLLQGISGGLIGVVVPLYLAECLDAKSRGKGTGMFQFLLTVGLVAAAFIGLFYASKVEGVESLATSTRSEIFAVKDSAWRSIFWVSIVPGVLFLLGGFFVAESPRWLFARGKKAAALKALAKSNGETGARTILSEMEAMEKDATEQTNAGKVKEGLLKRKYVIPFILAILILACNQATGINSVLAYAVNIFNQGGLSGHFGNQGDVVLKVVNCLMTIVAVILVDKKGRKFLLKMGTGAIMVALLCAGLLFRGIEGSRVDITEKAGAYKSVVAEEFGIDISNPNVQKALGIDASQPAQVFVAYSYGPISNNRLLLWDPDKAHKGIAQNTAISIHPPSEDDMKESVIGSFFRSIHLNPFANPAEAKGAPLKIEKVSYGLQPGKTTGWLVAACFVIFIAGFASGPGVCVWLALSELMPTRIRSMGMSIALLINQAVSTTIAAVFLPTVGKYGYSTMFFFWMGCTVVYFITAACFLPETKGKTLEEIEEHFEGKQS